MEATTRTNMTGARWGRRRRRAALAGTALGSALLVPLSTAGAVVPGTNGQIAFESNRDGNPEIYAMNADGTVERNLTNHPGWDFYPVWSPDGTQIAWGSDRAEPGNVDVWVMDADGSDPVQLTDSPGEDRGASWTSDGEKIVFHSARNRTPSHAFDLFIMDADGDNETLLRSNASAGYVCGDSETGRIVFNSSDDGDFDIYTMDIDGSDVVNLTDNDTFDSGPKWSPDCTQISFNRLDHGGSLDVFRMNADGSDQVNLTNAPGVFDAFSAWSPDGQEIVFSSNRDVNFEVYRMDSSDGAGVQRLTHTKRGQADLRSDWGTAPAHTGPPTDKQQCKDDEWQVFTTPSFANQGECVAFAESSAP